MRAGRAFGPPGTSAAAVFGGAAFLECSSRGPRALFPGPRASSFSAGLPPAPAAENPAWPRLLFEVSFDRKVTPLVGVSSDGLRVADRTLMNDLDRRGRRPR